MTKAFDALNERVAIVNDLLNAMNILTWDSRTKMPKQGAETRGQQIATLTSLAREQILSDEMRRALEQAEEAAADLPHDAPERRAAEQVRHAVTHHSRVSAKLINERAALRAVAHVAWHEAKNESDFSIFLPYLEKTMELTRAYADAIGWEEHPYDALLSMYEPGETAKSLQALYAKLRAGIRPVIAAAAERPEPRRDFVFRHFPQKAQAEFGKTLAAIIGYDFDRGRLDNTVHPFEISFTRNDVRITSRYNENYLPASVLPTSHEVGHALYELNIDPAYTRTALATDMITLYAVGGTSFGAHESQSRLLENHVVRTRRFWQHHFGTLQAAFPGTLDDVTADEFYDAVTYTSPGLIRVDADELHYDMHIMLRTDLECAILDGSLKPKDIPGVWAERIKEDLGQIVPDDARGCLQDIHWSSGYVGTFPTYTIGNVMAAQLMESFTQTKPEVAAGVEAGDYAPLQEALRSAVWQHGRRFTRDEILLAATGKTLEPSAYIAYLTQKYS